MISILENLFSEKFLFGFFVGGTGLKLIDQLGQLNFATLSPKVL